MFKRKSKSNEAFLENGRRMRPTGEYDWEQLVALKAEKSFWKYRLVFERLAEDERVYKL